MNHTPFLSVIPQRHAMDCGVCCLAMLLGVSYETALIATRMPSAMTTGMTTAQIKATAKRLGKPLKTKRTFDLDSDTGILCVRSATKWGGLEHVVVLKDGLIVDTDASLWDADVFLAAYDADAFCLYVLA